MNRHEEYIPHDYVIYYDENSVRYPIKCVAVGSRKAAMLECKVLKGVHCTYPEACALTRRMNLEYKVTRKKGRPKND